MNKCLFCYSALDDEDTVEFHVACSKKIFNTYPPPGIPYSDDQVLELANQVIKSQFAITGAQPKLSLEIEKKPGNLPWKSKHTYMPKFTIVGLWGNYILKPQSSEYPHLPEIEDLTMRLAEISGIATVPHALVRMRNGTLAYLTRRIDRSHHKNRGHKLFMEDMCQLTGRLTENKYGGSYESIAKAILKYSANPVLDVINFFEQLVFSFLTGNSDMHLKNFSLYGNSILNYTLAPAYDMVSTSLVLHDHEEMALTLNGKKNNLQLSDFTTMFNKFSGSEKSIENIFTKFSKAVIQYETWIERSFIPEEKKEIFMHLLQERARRLQL